MTERPLYEYRRYECVPGRIAALRSRFENVTFGFWNKHGIRCLAMWEAIYGDSDTIHYILVWDSVEDRQRRRAAFQSDRAWQEARADSERDGPLIARIHNELWTLTSFSPVPGVIGS